MNRIHAKIVHFYKLLACISNQDNLIQFSMMAISHKLVFIATQ